MRVQKELLIFGLAMVWTAVAYAQTVTIPYSMSFEENASEALDLSQNWVLNAGSQAAACNDRWMVGSSVHSDGKRALYIVSSDTLTTPCFGKQANLQFAYRDFKLPAGSYYLSFDWLNAAGADAALYVGYVVYTNPTAGSVTYITANSGSGVMPTALVAANNSGALYGKSTWQQYTFPRTINVSAASTGTYRLYVAWANKGGNTLADSVFGACVDNIQIVDSRVVPAKNIVPTSVSCDTVRLSWKGSADTYIVQYRKVGNNIWNTVNYDSSMGTSVLIEGLEEGSYNFRVRSISYDKDGKAMYGAYAYYQGEYLVYCADRHCLSYFDLHGANVKCTSGKTTYMGDLTTNMGAPFENVGIIDHGAESDLSRHTVCWDKTATDPRTGDKLRIVPSDALASVRLGNWRTGNEAEGITYTMTVDSAYSILLLRYAVVLEDPNHDSDEQPRFTIEICDAKGQKIDPVCGYINFAADATRKGWNTEGSGYYQVTWKDWTTIGLNLTDYVGQTLTIKLATYDCTLGGHYGYAYFTLDCTGATIETIGCGSDTHFAAEAPAGFAYKWMTQDGTIVSTQRMLDTYSIDSVEYTCRLSNLENSDCWFELKVLALPKFPISDGTWSYTPVDCKNRVSFKNRSYVQTRYNGEVYEDHSANRMGFRWDFGDGTESLLPDCTHDFPSEGGTFTVSLSTWLAEESADCISDTVFVVTIPAIGDTVVKDTVDICDGSYYDFGGTRYTDAGDYTYDGLSEAGCHILYMCQLRVHPTDENVLSDMHICYGDTFCLNDSVCYLSEKDGRFHYTFVNRYGCDSVVVANIRYADEILPVLDVTQMSEEVEEAVVRIGGSGYNYYTIDGGEQLTSPLFTTTEAGDYMFSFYNDLGCVDSVSVNIKSPCLRNRLFQRWNDIVAIYNNEYMQDTLEFVAYQWYEDEEPIEGATMSYYCAPGGLRIGAAYSCRVTLADGSQATVCPLIAQDLVTAPAQVSVAPTAVPQGGSTQVYMPAEGSVRCYDALGNMLSVSGMPAGKNILSLESLDKGMYLVQVTQPEGVSVHRITIQ